MDKMQILLFSAIFAFLAVRLYQKYIKKDKAKSGGEKLSSNASFPSSSTDDDYEPYSKK
jgi:hypothetical protein